MPGKITKLTRNEMLAVMRFVADVASLKADPLAQRRFVIDGILNMIGGEVGYTYLAVGFAPGEATQVVAAVHSTGGETPFGGYAQDVVGRFGMSVDPYCVDTVARPESIVSVGWRHVMPDRAAHARSEPFLKFKRDFAIGDAAVVLARLDARLDSRFDARAERPIVAQNTIFGVGAHRFDAGRSPVSARQRAMAEFAIAECAGLIARGHLAVPELAAMSPGGDGGKLAGLAPRPREVLRHLLNGTNPKAIARAMGITLWTVREYQATIYRTFDVNGRDELMAKFVRGEPLPPL